MNNYARRYSGTYKVSPKRPAQASRPGRNWSSRAAQGKAGRGGKSSTIVSTLINRFRPGTARRKRILKFVYTSLAIGAVFMVIGSLVGLAKLQDLTKDLPDPDKPFDNPRFRSEASVIYDRNGVELYRLFSDNRDVLRIPEGQTFEDVVPPQLKWAFLAAEDIDFYSHPGFDIAGILGCGIASLRSGGTVCGGSTITQQVVKLAGLENSTQSIERKLKELVYSIQLERARSKDEILLLYFNIVNEGGNVYGVKTAARYYFGKELSELNFAEAAEIAAIANNPSILSPTRSVRPDLGKDMLRQRRNDVVLRSMLRYKDKINEDVRAYNQRKAEREGREMTDAEKADFVTEALITEAQGTELAYQPPQDKIQAGHFVFFVKDLLKTRGYNDGEPFKEEQLNRGGYRIYTTLDYNMQRQALQVVQEVAQGPRYGQRYGAKNSAMMTMIPRTGEILTMIGSKCYDNAELANCSELDGPAKDSFDSKVNILTTLQQPGSSIKPLEYYEAYRQGIVSPGSQMADVPIEVGNYKPNNSDRGFTGINSARLMLALSRNIPAVELTLAITPARLAQLKKEIGYNANVDPANYGPSSALGANDVLGVEHANAFATLANGGSFVPYEAVLRIEDSSGNIIWDLNGKDKPEAKQVMDEKAVFMVNDSTNPRSITGSNSPVKWTDKRDMSGKTGTSEENRDNWFVLYSPDFVTVGWSGNNDNKPMASQSFGSTNAEPWVREFMQKVGDSEYFKARTAYRRPAGIVSETICGKLKIGTQEQQVCEGNRDYLISGQMPPVRVTKQVVDVCKDQTDKLARDIDKALGLAEQREFNYVKMVVADLQKHLDNYLQGKQGSNGAPTAQCDVNRSPNGNLPWAQIMAPQPFTSSTEYIGNVDVNVNGYNMNGGVAKLEFFLGSTKIGETSNSSYLGTLAIPSGTTPGQYDFRVRVCPTAGCDSGVGESSVRITVSAPSIGLAITAPANNATLTTITPLTVTASYTGTYSGVIEVEIRKSNGDHYGLSPYTLTGSGSPRSRLIGPLPAGTYTLRARAVGVNQVSAPITITVS